jgi:hypothetical protein
MVACPCPSILIFILDILSYIPINEMLSLFKEGSQKILQLSSVDDKIILQLSLSSDFRMSLRLYGYSDKVANHILEAVA